MESLDSSVRRLEELFTPPTLLHINVIGAKLYTKKAKDVRVKCAVIVDDTEEVSSAESDYVKHQGSSTWGFRFACTLHSFGSTAAPATLKLELYSEGFFMDTFLGSATIPLAKFADGQENKFKLPVFASEQKILKDPEALIEFTMQTSINIRSLLTTAEINEIWAKLTVLKPHLSKDVALSEKFSLIVELQRQKEEQQKRLLERNRPAHFVSLLRDNTMTENDWKKIKYNMGDATWQVEFLELFSGLDYIFHHLAKIILNLQSRVIARNNEDREKVSAILVCLQRIVTYVMSNDSLLITTDYVETLFSASLYIGERDKLLILEITKMLLSGVHGKVAVDSLLNVFIARPEISLSLVQELIGGDNLLYKIALLDLLNIALKRCEDEEDLDTLKHLCYKRGITFSSLQQLQKDFPDDEILDLVCQYIENAELTEKYMSKDDQIWEYLAEIKKLKEDLDKLQNAAKYPGSFAYPVPPHYLDKQRAAIDNAGELGKTMTAPAIVIHDEAKPETRKEAPLLNAPKVELNNSGGPLPFIDGAASSLSNPRLSSVISTMLETPSRRNSRKLSRAKMPGPLQGPLGAPGAPPPPPPPGRGPPVPPPRPGLGITKGAPKSKILALRLKNISANDLEETVFSELDTVDKEKNQLDLNSLTEMFTTSLEPVPSLRRTKSAGSLKLHGNPEDDLIDARRRQQVAILLKRLPVAVDDLRKSLSSLTLVSLSKESLDLVASLFSKKNDDEYSRFDEFSGNVSQLGEAERFLFECYQIPRLTERLPLLVFRTNFPQMISEAEKSGSDVAALIAKLKEAPFKLLLSYVVDIANILRTGGSKVQGFQLSSLPKLMELKSPHDNKTTLLHFLVGSVDEKAPQTLEFATKLLDLANVAPNAMAKFQGFFPNMIERLITIETEIEEAQKRIEALKSNRNTPVLREVRDLEFEMEFLTNLKSLKEEIEALSKRFHAVIVDIEDDIQFFGNHENDAPEDATTREIKGMWRRLASLGSVPEAHCLERAKRDEDRFTFLIQIQRFIQDLKKASIFVKAQKEKEKQRKAYQELVSDNKETLDDVQVKPALNEVQSAAEKEILNIVTPKKSLVLPKNNIGSIADGDSLEEALRTDGTPQVQHSRRRPTKSRPSTSSKRKTSLVTSTSQAFSPSKHTRQQSATVSHKRKTIEHSIEIVQRGPSASVSIPSTTQGSTGKRLKRSKSLTQADGEVQQSLAKDLRTPVSDFIASSIGSPSSIKAKSVSLSTSTKSVVGTFVTGTAAQPAESSMQPHQASTSSTSSLTSDFSHKGSGEVTHSRKRR